MSLKFGQVMKINKPNRRHKQSGSMLIIAIFTLVVLGGLAAVMSRIEWSTSDTHTREFMSAQAWMLASSANEWALTQFYPLNGNFNLKDTCTDGANPVNGATYQRIAQDVCEAVSMSCRSAGELEGNELFVVTATATCGTGAFQVQRRQEVWVRE